MSSADVSPPWDLLARQLAGEATPADEAAVRAWCAATPANAAVWQQLTGVWTEAGAAATTPVFGPADTAQAWQQFEANVLGPSPPGAPAAPSAPPATPGVLEGWGKVAALLVAGAGAGWVLRTAIPAAPESAAAPITHAASADSVNGSAALGAEQAGPAPVDLVFEETPVAEVAQRLEHTFAGLHVVVADSVLARQRFTGTFQAARPVAVLRVMTLATGATLTHRADSAWVVGRNQK
jgi:ferric-dicitrate binding protein FerR (iron transport regulator)